MQEHLAVNDNIIGAPGSEMDAVWSDKFRQVHAGTFLNLHSYLPPQGAFSKSRFLPIYPLFDINMPNYGLFFQYGANPNAKDLNSQIESFIALSILLYYIHIDEIPNINL